ncbi:MAG: hypothetical protein WDN00_13675 [Limisphaerales bacterium]
MHSIDDLLHLVNSDRAEALKLQVGVPPIITLDGEQHQIEGAPITAEDVEQFLQKIVNTRQRRELRKNGTVQFVYRFRNITDFVVCARIEKGNVRIDIE